MLCVFAGLLDCLLNPYTVANVRFPPMRPFLPILALAVLSTLTVAGSQVVISEFLAVSDSGIVD